VLESIDEARLFCKDHQQFIVLGKGSNSIVSESAFQTPFVQVSSQLCLPSLEHGILELSAGTTVQQLLRLSLDLSISGFEFMAGVPASIGGMIAMNFGCWGKEIADMIQSVDVLTDKNELLRLPATDCGFSYRHSVFQEKSWIILSARLTVTHGDRDLIKSTIKRYVDERLAKQPIRGKTFGSVFKNPEGFSAAKLIESLGFKGYEKDGVQVSSQHANFFENTGTASYDSVLSMIQLLQHEVKKSYSVTLVPEVKLIT
jgi:UDP-N-acetylmuramate dehydrogenase